MGLFFKLPNKNIYYEGFKVSSNLKKDKVRAGHFFQERYYLIPL